MLTATTFHHVYFLYCRTTTRVLLNIFRRKFRIGKVLKFCTTEKGVENTWHQLQVGLLKVDEEELFFPPKLPCLQLHLECCKHNCTSCPGICAYHSYWQCRENQFYMALRTVTLMEGSIWLSGLHGHFNLIERGTAWAKIEKCKDHKPNQVIPFPGATIYEGRFDPLFSCHVMLDRLFFVYTGTYTGITDNSKSYLESESHQILRDWKGP